MSERALSAFEAYGIEIEYMIVDRDTLAVRPLCDRLMTLTAGSAEAEVERGPMAWSNELALHVVELKTNGPAPALEPLPERFQAEIAAIDALLAPENAMLLPGGMHPWMDPFTETRLWQHEHHRVYEAYNRIFDCRGHGWSNLQSTHLNLPFANDEEFRRLHTAIRVLLPLLPALAAASPLAGGQPAGSLDARMRFYAGNARAIPSITGAVIPELIGSQAEYHERILAPMYRDIAAHDPDGILQHEWLNSRGAIARFDRMAIEIRVLDTQEYPLADIAIAALTSAVLEALYTESTSSERAQAAVPTAALAALLERCVDEAEQALVGDEAILGALGLEAAPMPAGEVWHRLCRRHAPADPLFELPLAYILQRGSLARRLLAATGGGEGGRLARVYGELATCLREGRPFTGLGADAGRSDPLP